MHRPKSGMEGLQGTDDLDHSPRPRVSERVAGTLVSLACSRPRSVILLFSMVALFAALHVARNFAIDTDVTKLFPAGLAWRQAEIALAQAFPEREDLIVVVVDASTSGQAEHAAASLAAALASRPELFRVVRRPDAGEFFERHALLYLPLTEVEQTTGQLIAAQPLLATLAAEPSLHGVLAAISLMLQGVEHDVIPLSNLTRPLATFAETAEAAAAGSARPLDWSRLVLDRDPSALELRRFILVHPQLDFSALSPGAAAEQAIREAAGSLGLDREPGLRLRLTGPIPLADEEFASVAEGALVNTLLTAAIEALLLWLALRSVRLIAPVLTTVVVGLVVTAAFGLFAFGAFNLISVAFAVLFIGLGDDQSVQFAVRYREERHRLGALEASLRAAGRNAGPAMGLAALAIGAGFLSLAPTEYRGMAELGVIAGNGMLLAWLLSLTLLPALLRLTRPPGEPGTVGYAFLAPLDAVLRLWAKSITALAGLLALGALAVLPWLEFDFNPMNLRDPRSEAMAALHDLAANPETSPNTLDVLAPDLPTASALAARLETVPEVAQALTLQSFVPEGQPEKLALIADAAMLLGPALVAPEGPGRRDDAVLRQALSQTAAALEGQTQTTGDAAARRLARALEALAIGDPAARARFATAIEPGLRTLLRQVSRLLQAGPVTLADLPPELVRDWIAPDGRARVEAAPRDTSGTNGALRRFAEAVQAVAPDATGAPVSIRASSETILRAFLLSGLLALLLVAALLALALRDARLVALALAPLVLAGLLTLATCALIGPSLNLANIIALPLLFGMGVAFDVYYVSAWQAGRRALLSTGLTRAVLFSTLTTLGAFGTLALSSHPGTASMGVLLLVSLAYILVVVLLGLPAMLHALARRA